MLDFFGSSAFWEPLFERRASKAPARSTMGREIWWLTDARNFVYDDRTVRRPYGASQDYQCEWHTQGHPCLQLASCYKEKRTILKKAYLYIHWLCWLKWKEEKERERKKTRKLATIKQSLTWKKATESKSKQGKHERRTVGETARHSTRRKKELYLRAAEERTRKETKLYGNHKQTYIMLLKRRNWGAPLLGVAKFIYYIKPHL